MHRRLGEHVSENLRLRRPAPEEGINKIFRSTSRVCLLIFHDGSSSSTLDSCAPTTTPNITRCSCMCATPCQPDPQKNKNPRQTTKIPFAKIAKTPRSSPTCENRIFSDEALRGPPAKIKNIFFAASLLSYDRRRHQQHRRGEGHGEKGCGGAAPLDLARGGSVAAVVEEDTIVDRECGDDGGRGFSRMVWRQAVEEVAAARPSPPSLPGPPQGRGEAAVAEEGAVTRPSPLLRSRKHTL
uniref:Uncharacterized protein n=1 Tax=Oryza sativa subsp. japonica TaxID=39947 RepID=Q75GA8_ORYSJ|nr:hypothetical protein [Oryza sativa Japonica Group]